MNKARNLFLTVLGVAALAVPASAIAFPPGQGQGKGPGQRPGTSTPDQYTEQGPGKGKGKSKGKSKGKRKGHGKPAAFIFKGTYKGDGVVSVTGGNSRVRKGGFIGKDVTFDLSAAKFTVADVNGDGKTDATDVKAGDKVVVQCKLPRKDPGSQPFKARKLVDQTNPKPKEEDEKPPAS